MLKRLGTRTGGGALATEIASQVGLSAEQVGRALAEVERRVSLEMQRVTLSRGGLADLVAALGAAQFLGPPEQSAGKLLLFLLGSEARVRALCAAVAQSAGIAQDAAERVVPRLALAQFKGLVERSRPGLNELFGRMPSLFHWSLGGMHADIADIIRRRCGAGPYDRRALRRRVRAILAHAGGFAPAGAAGWYARTALSPLRSVAGMIARSLKQPSTRG